MKNNYLYTTGVLLLFALVFVACSKKERNPALIVHVQEQDETPADGAWVHVWTADAGQPGSTVNELMFDQEGYTDDAGNLTFNFPFSAVLDVDVIYYKNYLDTLLNPAVDTLYGHRVVKIESVRQSSEENDYRETVEVQ